MLNGNQKNFFKESLRHITGGYMNHSCQRNVRKSVSTPWKGAFPSVATSLPDPAQPHNPENDHCLCKSVSVPSRTGISFQSTWLLILHSTCPSVSLAEPAHRAPRLCLSSWTLWSSCIPSANWPSPDKGEH